jgi:uncharacterized repeat protein (TIGR03803 family)
MLTLNCCKNIGACFLLFALTAISSSAQTFTELHAFDHNDGAQPFGTLVQGLDGNFYGTTRNGNGQNQCLDGCGEVFKITPDGTLTIFHSFDKTDGGYPMAGLVLGTDGNFYGSTNGANTSGTPPASFIFKITADGTLTSLTAPNAAVTSQPLLQNVLNGSFYGTSPQASGESNDIFSMTGSGTVTDIHNFCGFSNCGGVAKGNNPQAPLIQGSDEFMYGTTQTGGISDLCDGGCGTVYKVGTGGNLTTLHAFDGTDGAGPEGSLVEGNDGNFYGTTVLGDSGVFKMTPAGEVTVLHTFCLQTGCPDGDGPAAGVIQATDGNFYGTTVNGGANATDCSGGGCGTVFQITSGGVFTVIHSFDKADGEFPQAGLVQGTDGNLYGVTTGYQGIGAGTVFKISMGLAPFVKTVPLAANPGKQIFILSNNLTGTTSVTFNGKAATFTVVSATEITATVPAGSSTGTVVVTTPGGTLSSNLPFRVL